MMTSSEPETDSTNSSRHSFYNLCSTHVETPEDKTDPPYGFMSPRGSIQSCELCNSFISSVTNCPHKYLPEPPSRAPTSKLMGRRRSSFPSLESLKEFQKTQQKSAGSTTHSRRKTGSSTRAFSDTTLPKKVSLSGVMLASVVLPYAQEDENDADDDDDDDEDGDRGKGDLNDSGHSSTFSFSRQSSLDHQYFSNDQDASLPKALERRVNDQDGVLKYKGRRFRVISEERYENLTSRSSQSVTSANKDDNVGRIMPEAPAAPKQRADGLKRRDFCNSPGTESAAALVGATPIAPPSIDVISPSPTLTTDNIKTSQSVRRQLLQSNLSLRAITPEYLNSRSSGTSSSGSISPASLRCTSSRSNSSIDSTSPLPPLVRTPTLRRGNLLPPIYTGSRTPSTASSSRTSSPFDAMLPSVFSPIINAAPEFPDRDPLVSVYRDFSDTDIPKSPVEITTTTYFDDLQGAVASYHPLPSPLASPCETSPRTERHHQRKGRSQSPISTKTHRRNKPGSKSQTSACNSDETQSLRGGQQMLNQESVAKSGGRSSTDDTVRSHSRSTNSSIDVMPPDQDDYYIPPLQNEAATGDTAFHLPDINKRRQSSAAYKSSRKSSAYKLDTPMNTAAGGRASPKRRTSPNTLADLSLKGNSIKLVNTSKKNSQVD